MDVGSTTLKIVILSEDGQLLYKSYERHFSKIQEKTISLLSSVKDLIKDEDIAFAISGSAGMGIAKTLDIPFVQEVFATREAAKKYLPNTDAIIELGGEDAKILFLTNGLEVRMNGTCAGGTGSFIDQMSSLLNVSVEEINALSEKSEQLYTIASRCGVFAKTDIQPLINQGAKKEDIASSILVSVVNQTIAGLSQGRKIKGNIAYLGGPLTFIPRLRHFFDEALETKGISPDNSLFFVALGTALSGLNDKRIKLDELVSKIEGLEDKGDYESLTPLFSSRKDYERFIERHNRATVKTINPANYKGNAYLGVDAGSTTIKLVLISEEGDILLSRYGSNKGNPIVAVKSFLEKFYNNYPDITIKASASTGYGEDLIKTAFNLDFSLVETQAHLFGAQHFKNDVDFIIDIGGQDIKCFKIKDSVIEDIYLNEACSSGCGSFLQTFATALGEDIHSFSEKAIDSRKPADLGSRCTVFMNSSVKQAQKDGASVEDISAGLAISVVKNAIYKVIRATSAESLGKNIVVQGGTFLNNGVLRAFENELKTEVIRPTISALMGAYGAALYSRKKVSKKPDFNSSIISKEKLISFEQKTNTIHCNGCTNHCLLTINIFGERKLISGNNCEKPIKKEKQIDQVNTSLYAHKQELFKKYIDDNTVSNTTIGLPLALGMWELLPLWHTFFKSLGYAVITSPFSTKEMYTKGQDSIPSDTACFPAKLMHGHIDYLVEKKVDYIFLPAMTYNLDEKRGNNHFNCPVVAYYPEVIKANQDTKDSKILSAYISLNNRGYCSRRLAKLLSLPVSKVRKALNLGFKELEEYHSSLREKAKQIISLARENNEKIIVLAGRPYHTDPEIEHNIDKLITSLGPYVISEDSLTFDDSVKPNVNVLNQWTYHSRLYDAANIVSKTSDMELVQLVSFGCGLDAVTTDEVKEMLAREDKIYTQVKIDEITNVGAVKIRLRSLLSALEMRN